LTLPASQIAIERAIKSLRRFWEKRGPPLGADVELRDAELWVFL
jgi:ribosomal protein L5